MGEMDLLTTGEAGVVDTVGAAFGELPPREMSYRISDHFPIWVEFLIDRSTEQMARTLGVDPGAPNPFYEIADG
jgi:hypothetical protein